MSEMTVGELENLLYDCFPFEDAEPWDLPGLSVGDRLAKVDKVAVDLDLTPQAVIAADAAGCNVLITHHPLFIKEGPSHFAPIGAEGASAAGSAVFEAARRGIALISMHTNLDRSLELRGAFNELLGWPCVGNYEHLDDADECMGKGFGAVYRFDAPRTLSDIAIQASEVFGKAPRVWGDASRNISCVALLNGSWSDPQLGSACVARGIDCILVGEMKYHSCLDAPREDLSIIELGHDRSELPVISVLKKALLSAGLENSRIIELNLSQDNWWTPKTGDR